MCHIPKAAEFCIWFLYLYFVFENNESRNIASEYRKLISLISSILNVASCHTMCFTCKVWTDKFCCLRNFCFFQPAKDICVLRTGRAQNWAKAVEGNRQQNPSFQSTSPTSRYLNQLPPACLLLVPWLLNSWPRGILTAKGELKVFLTGLTCSVMVRLYSPVMCDVAGSQGRSSHFPAKSQQHSCLLEEILPPGPRPTALGDTYVSQRCHNCSVDAGTRV